MTIFVQCKGCSGLASLRGLVTRVRQVVDALLATARSAWQPEDAGDFVLGDPTLRSAMETSSLFAFLDGALFPTCPLRRGLREGLRQVGVGVGYGTSP